MASPFNSKHWMQGLTCVVDDMGNEHVVARVGPGAVRILGKDSHEAKVLNALDRYRRAESIHAPDKARRRW